MSNHVDILCVGGPKHLTLINTKRPPPAQARFPDISGETGYSEVTYDIHQHIHRDTGAYYWIASHTDDAIVDADIIDMAIAEYGHKPAWDLNRNFPGVISNVTP